MSDADMNHLTEADLHAAAEGRGDVAEAGAIERHLVACASCRADVDRIRALLEYAATLPRAIEPPVDLWSGIRDRMHSASPSGNRWAVPRRAYLWLAAAAVLLIVASSAVTTLVLRGGDRPVATGHDEPASPDSGAGSPEYRAVSEQYDRMDRDLAALFASQRDKLQPETIEKVERNLAIIDEAISEIRRALAEDPGNEALRQLLKASYGQKAALLRQVSQS